MGSVVSSVAGQFFWLNVYRMTQGHNSCQSAPPLGAGGHRGNLFSLARLSSHTETVFVLFDCTAPLGSLTLLSPSLLSPLLNILSFFFFLSLSASAFFLVSVSPYSPLASSRLLSPPLFLHPPLPPSTVTQG